ncbi:MAG: 1-acyl-sn-glycerol-3-phosphate acyltransferase [Porphyromonas sp.]|nr:1-acyl-sn-glycerol-3-phosphate acyltransferase [Porphyromonas sp.]
MELIDIKKVIRQKYKGYMPNFVFKWLERLIEQDELNRLHTLTKDMSGVDAADRLIEELDQSVEVIGADRLPPKEERCLFVSNHPLGGADGIIYTSLLGRYYDGNIALLVNDVLLNLEQFSDVFVPVNKYGTQGRDRHKMIEEALQSDKQVFTFPAGLCSRLENGEIRDTEWHVSFVRMAKRSQRTVVPLYFDGVNSDRFYNWANRRKRMGVKFNYELILLPSEFVHSKGKHYRIYVGEPIAPEDLPSGTSIHAFADRVYQEIYNYPERYANEPKELLVSKKEKH